MVLWKIELELKMAQTSREDAVARRFASEPSAQGKPGFYNILEENQTISCKGFPYNKETELSFNCSLLSSFISLGVRWGEEGTWRHFPRPDLPVTYACVCENSQRPLCVYLSLPFSHVEIDSEEKEMFLDSQLPSLNCVLPLLPLLLFLSLKDSGMLHSLGWLILT
jgi:hypothetical protein